MTEKFDTKGQSPVHLVTNLTEKAIAKSDSENKGLQVPPPKPILQVKPPVPPQKPQADPSSNQGSDDGEQSAPTQQSTTSASAASGTASRAN